MKLSLQFPSERVVQLEAELQDVRSAFEQYVTNTKEMEAALDQELADLHSKLASSTSANKELGEQLEKMEPMFGGLEKSLEISKTRLRDETKLRRQAEIAADALREDNKKLREEFESLKNELSVQPSLSQLPDPLTVPLAKSQLSGDERYTEILDELDTVTTLLLEKQQELWAAEDKLRRSQGRFQMSLSQLVKMDPPSEEQQKSLLDMDESFDATTIDMKLTEELRQVKCQLEKTQRDLKIAGEHAVRARERRDNGDQSEEANAGTYDNSELHRQVRYLKETLAETEAELGRCRKEYAECRDENATLVEEIACLRDVLQGNADRELADEKRHQIELQALIAERDKRLQDEQANATRMREKEINALRGKLKNIVKENAILSEKLNRVEDGGPLTKDEQVLTLKKEVIKLQRHLDDVEETHEYAMQELEIDWNLKLEKVRSDLEKDKEFAMKELHVDMLKQRKIAIDALESRVEQLIDEKQMFEKSIEAVKRELQHVRKENVRLGELSKSAEKDLKESQDEALSLKKRIGILEMELQQTMQNFDKTKSLVTKSEEQYANVCAELEVARQILDEAGLMEETIAREDEAELKRQIHQLSKELERVRADYAELENEFLDSQHRFCDSQEEASRKTADEIHYLTGKISEMETALEAARNDYSDVSIKLEALRKESHASLKKAEKKGRENILDALTRRDERDILASKDSETEGLDAQVGQLMTQLEKTKLELHDCRKQLEASNSEAAALQKRIDQLENDDAEDDETSDDSLATRYGGNSSRVSSVHDSGEGFEVIQSSTKKQFQCQQDIDQLQLQLQTIIKENTMLKGRIEKLGLNEYDSSDGVVNTLEVKKLIKDLEHALKTNETMSDELERVSRKLATAERKLMAAQRAIEDSNDENDDLRAEIQSLKLDIADAKEDSDNANPDFHTSRSREREENHDNLKRLDNASETNVVLKTEQKEEFQELRDRLKTLTEEKVALQHELDDTKIALSVSHYAQERNKEALRASEAKLSNSADEIYELKYEIGRMSRNLSEVKQAYDDVLDELEHGTLASHDGSSSTKSPLVRQLEDLSNENSSLQQAVSELEKALNSAQDELIEKSKQVNTLHDALVSTQKETKLLTNEISNLTTAFEASRAEYDSVVDELEAVCELFEEATEEAERTGKEEAIREIQSAISGSRYKERHAMREHAKKILEENASLNKKLSEAEAALVEAQGIRSSEEKVLSTLEEVKKLREALRKSENEIHNLKETEFNLTVALKEAKIELRSVKDELETTNRSFDDSRRAAERTVRASVVEHFLSREEGNSELEALRKKLNRLVEECEEDTMMKKSSDSAPIHRNDAVALKIELINMSMTLEKIMKENAIIEEELEYVTKSAEEARKEGEKEGELQARQSIIREMKIERERETRELKEQFNRLSKENGVLVERLRQAELNAAEATKAHEQSMGEIVRLKEGWDTAKYDCLRLQQEVVDLTTELEASRENHEALQVELSFSSVDTDGESKIRALQRKLNALMLERTKLQTQLRTTESNLLSSRTAEASAERELRSAHATHQASQAKIVGLEREIAVLNDTIHDMKSSKDKLSAEMAAVTTNLRKAEIALDGAKATENEVEILQKILKITKAESSSLKIETKLLKRSLEDSIKEVIQLREQVERMSGAVSEQESPEVTALRSQLARLAEEKTALQKEVDESKVELSLQKYTHYQDPARDLDGTDTRKAYDEMQNAKAEIFETMGIMKKINQMLDTVEIIEIDDTESEDILTVRASSIKKKVSKVISLLRQTRQEKDKISIDLNTATMDIESLKRRIESNETALQDIHGLHSQEKTERADLEIKYARVKKEATSYRNEIKQLKSALEHSQQDHATLRQQLETMNIQVAEMCKVNELRNAHIARESPSSEDVTSEPNRQELMDQFQRYRDEKLMLQSKLDIVEAALAASQEAEEKLKSTINEMETKSKETTENAHELESRNRRLRGELQSLRNKMSIARDERSSGTIETIDVEGSLDEKRTVKEHEDGAVKSHDGPSARDSEIRLLQEQFKKLSAKSQKLGKQVEETEAIVNHIREKQQKTQGEVESRRKKAQELQDLVKVAIEHSEKRARESDDLNRTIENRVSIAEGNVGKLETAITGMKEHLHVTAAELVVAKQHQELLPDNPDLTREDDGTSRSNDEDTIEESREESSVKSTAIPREAPPSLSASSRETNLTTRALEALALCKERNQLRKMDLQRTQNKRCEGEMLATTSHADVDRIEISTRPEVRE